MAHDSYVEFVLRYLMVLIFFAVSPSVFAEAVQVSFDNKKYDINLTKIQIDFKEIGFSKKIKKEKCNATLVDQFLNEFKQNINNLAEIKSTQASKGAVKVSFDKKSRFAFRFQDEGKYFLDLSSKFKTLWLTSKRVCKR